MASVGRIGNGIFSVAAIPPKKRLFDIVFCLGTMPLWLPLLTVASLAVLVFSGRPVFYISRRRVFRSEVARVCKIRVMVRDAHLIANRRTVPVKAQRFLNLPLDAPIYTRVGRVIERYDLTELPQFLDVLRGKMSVIGNRPLPEDVIASLKEEFPFAEERFDSRCGLTGPVQLVGRQNISDADRLAVEVDYCKLVTTCYSLRLDVMLALYTALIRCRIREPLTLDEVHVLMDRWSGRVERETKAAH